jgi:type I restriction enzyme S subunit
MSGSKKRPLAPRLRFPKFRGAVSAVPLRTVAKFVGEKVNVDQINPFHYVSTESLLPDFGGMNSAGKLPSVLSVTSFKPNDILVSNIRPYLRKVWQANIFGGASNDVIVIRPSEHAVAHYLAAILMSDIFIDYVMRGTKGVKMPRGEISMIREFPVPWFTAEEQQKIAACLTSLDELITVETQKLDALKTHKKGLMQQLFPREGETVPRLRFPEFREGEGWIAKNLKNTCEVNPSNSGLPETFAYIDLESVEAGELKARKVINRAEAPSRAQRLLRYGDVIFQIVRPYQRNNLLFKIDEEIPFVASTGYAQLRAIESEDFLFQAVHADDFVERVIAKCTGSSYPAINSSDLADISLAIPSKTEQQKIADCLSSLDDLVTAETQKLDALKTHKKGLMQQLFPVLDEVSA